MEAVELFFLGCAGFPQPLDRSVAEPLRSAIPALVYLEALDIQTPAPWGRTGVRGLANAHVVDWASMGHVALAHDPDGCVGAIAAAFLAAPDRRPDSACARAAAFAVAFELPYAPK